MPFRCFSFLRGFGFVEFADVTASERAIAEMNGGVLDGREIKVERAKRNRGYDKTPGRCKFVYSFDQYAMKF